jgi:hypothetical protein
MRARSLLVVICLTGLSLGTAAAPAQALQHLMKVREVYAGSLIEANADFIELQMYSAGQSQVGGHKLTVYEANGSATECVIPSNVPNASNQATILFATTQAQSAFGTADFTIPPLLHADGGAVCFENFDCISWGSFGGAASAVDRNGGPGTPEPGGIPLGQSLDRRTDISGGAGTLEDADDTNNSANDLESENESATANGIFNLGSTTCTEIGGGGGDTDPPTSKITAPKHKTAVEQSQASNLAGTAKDSGGSGLAKVEIALRQKRQGGCKWWNGNRFVSGACRDKVFVQATGEKKWSYEVSKTLKPTGGKIKNYILYSRATDEAGNTETDFVSGANKSKFEVFKAPIVCAPEPC